MRTHSDNIKFYGDFIVIVTGAMTTRNHCHYAMELVVGLDSPFEMSQPSAMSAKAQAALIKSNTIHRISTGSGVTVSVLIDPQSEFAAILGMAFNTNPNVVLGESSTVQLVSYFSKYLMHHYHHDEITNSVSRIVSGDHERAGYHNSERITHILSIINKAEETSSSDFRRLVAASGLSESRLMHYFKEETGITIRKYIKWLRVQRAIKFIAQGYTIKDASSKAGFTDAAHFNRTFVSVFGVNPSTVIEASKTLSRKQST